MLTVFCLLVYGMWPNQLGIPIWALFVSIAVDLTITTAIKYYEFRKLKQK